VHTTIIQRWSLGRRRYSYDHNDSPVQNVILSRQESVLLPVFYPSDIWNITEIKVIIKAHAHIHIKKQIMVLNRRDIVLICCTVVCSVVLASYQSPAVSAKLVQGTVSSEDGFQYLSKFCYDWVAPVPRGVDDGSTMTLSIILQAKPDETGRLPENLIIAVFDDQANGWYVCICLLCMWYMMTG
jgi:hypothetical protein